MSASLHALALTEDLIPQVLPLIRATWPSVDLASWQNFVRAFTGPAAARGCGVIGLRDQAGCFCGVLACCVEEGLQAHPILAVHLFAVADLANSPHVLRALLGAAEAKALELGCKAIQIRLAEGQKKLASHLRALGLASHGTLLSKEIGLHN